MKKTIAQQAEDLERALYDFRKRLTELMTLETITDDYTNLKYMKLWVHDIETVEEELAIISAEIENMIGGGK